MNISFRGRVLVLVVILTGSVAGAGLLVSLLFERALQRTVTLEVDSGRILRAARELQITVLQQRSLFQQTLLLPPGPELEAARAEYERGVELLRTRSGELQAVVSGKPELEQAVQRFMGVLDEQFQRAAVIAAMPRTAQTATEITTGARHAAQELDPLLIRLIEAVRAAQTREMSAMDARLDMSMRQLIVLFMAAVLVVGALVFVYLDRAFARPMGRSIRIARDVAAGGLHARIPVDRNDEFGIFAEAFNRMLEELTGTHRRLEEVNRELESFSYTISHDLRAPLRSINGFAQILREEAAGQLDATQNGYLARIEAAAVRMGSMIQDMLDISRIGRGALDCSVVDLSALAEAVVAELRAADPARGVEVLVEPGVSVWGDAGLLRVVLDNLLGNAWKYTARVAGARIEFVAEAREGMHGFTVRDNGAGFDPAYANRLFRPFQRLHTSEEFEGIGIGLATVKSIVTRHGGHVEASAQPGCGASFRVLLPPAHTALAAG